MIIDMLAGSMDDKNDAKRIRFVCPSLPIVPSDSVFDFVSFTDLKGLIAELDEPSSQRVLMVSEKEYPVLELWSSNLDLFERMPVLMTGIPDANYESDFDAITYDFERAAYHSVVAEALEYVRREDSMTEQEKEDSVIKKEQSTFTRKNGTVKEFTAFDAPLLPGSSSYGGRKEEVDEVSEEEANE
jgi:hypothetical protein